MKIFISQGMKDKTPEEIKTEINKGIDYIKSLFPEDNVEILSTYFEDFEPEAAKGSPQYRIAFLGKSVIEGLAKCHIALFLGEWEQFIGCQCEHFIAQRYGIPIFFFKDL